MKKKTEIKDLEYYRKNAEENYSTTPISVLRYISEMESSIEQDKLKTVADKEFLINALNAYWNAANAELQKKDLGDIDKRNYEYQLNNSKRLMVELIQ